MKAAGFEYFHTDVAMREPINIDDPSYRATHGYGLAERRGSGSSAEPTKNPNQIYYEGLSASAREAYNQAFSGAGGEQRQIPLTDANGQQNGFLLAGGCEYAAYPDVYGLAKEIVVQDIDTLETMRNEFVGRVEVDINVIEARSRWTKCMTAKGWPEAEDRFHLRDALSRQFDDGKTTLNELSATEHRAASDDSLCAQSSDVDNVLRRAWVTLDAEFTEKARDLLAKYQDIPIADRS